MSKFNFNISLSVLNHLGRNLYRNFLTVIGEAISNSWDADAKNVWIDIDRDNAIMSIRDDGCGMNEYDFQNKFLKIGYSKRKNSNLKSKLGRPYIGRKGIGKLALLSCAKTICVASKADKHDVIGGVIDNKGLDNAIKDDISAHDYELEDIPEKIKAKLKNQKHGTYILFLDINDKIRNTVDYIKKAIAYSFRFSLLDPTFKIFVNEKEITIHELDDLATSTQFLWVINNYNDSYIEVNNLKKLKEKTYKQSDFSINGFIATVEKPRDLKTFGNDEKVGLDLFVNGRLREKNILKHISSARIVENYTYGQIHCNILDSGNGLDYFTSSREGLINDEIINKVYRNIKEIFSNIIDEWDGLRRKYKFEGDIDNKTLTPTERKSEELINYSLKDMGIKKSKKNNDLINRWVQKLTEESMFNIPSYTHCFISENLLRNYISYKNIKVKNHDTEPHIFKYRNNESKAMSKGNINFKIRQNDQDLFYLGIEALAKLAEGKLPNKQEQSICLSTYRYKPVRDAVAHTAYLTDAAKKSLEVDYLNIRGRVENLLNNVKSAEKSAEVQK